MINTYNKIRKAYEEKSNLIEKKNNSIFLAKNELLYEILEKFPPKLKQKGAKLSLESIYEAGYHPKTQTLFICDKGVGILSKTLKSEKYYINYYIGFVIYSPKSGLDIIDVDIIGDIKNSKHIIMRSESACSPSFIIGSQRCNCHDQWILTKELAAYYNPFEIPKNIKNPRELEKFIGSYFTLNDKNIPVPRNQGQGLVLMHLASQNGMGSGYNENSYCEDMTATTFLRHRGEYVAEQKHLTSMAGGFEAIGLKPDPRRFNNNFGYKIGAVIIDYFELSQKLIILLSNNTYKSDVLKNLGFNINNLISMGRADLANQGETDDRRKEFEHKIPDGIKTTIEEDFDKVIKNISNIK